MSNGDQPNFRIRGKTDRRYKADDGTMKDIFLDIGVLWCREDGAPKSARINAIPVGFTGEVVFMPFRSEEDA